jgi:adenylylsulfate kinase
MIEKNKRTLVKTISWRFLGFVILSVLSSLVVSSMKEVGVIALGYHAIMMILYFFHERAWNTSPWGKTSGLFVQMTGMSGAGKTTLAMALKDRLQKKGLKIEIIDGDEYRKELCEDLGFSREDREQNIKRLSFMGKVLGRNNVICIMSAINPYNSTREEVKRKNSNSKMVYVKCSQRELISRDTKGLYRRALLEDGHPDKVYNFTGISDPFDEPANADLIIETDKENILLSIEKLENFIIKNI